MAIRVGVVILTMMLFGCASEGSLDSTTSSSLPSDTTLPPRVTTTEAAPTSIQESSTTSAATSSSTSDAGVVQVLIADIRYDGPGNDVEFGDSEYVLLRNEGASTVDVSGWSLEDESDHVITIPDGYVIDPGGELRIYSGPGDSNAGNYFEGLSQAIWNNSGGDTATLRDSGGAQVDTFTYSS